MNWSKYNFLFKSTKYGYLIYNTLTNSFAELDELSYSKLEQIQSGKQTEDNIFTLEEIEKLKKAKIIVADDYDEYLKIKLQRHINRFDKSRMLLTLAPTLHCNFACSYCFEESRPKVSMTDEIEDATINFIKRHSEVKSLSITWFGGEPLLNFDRIISLTKKIESLNLVYNASIITNGYLLTQEVIDKLLDLKIILLHVTLDGLEKNHNERRPHITEKDSFEVIYSNMLRLKPLLKDKKVRLTVRVNVDHTNEDHFHEIYEKINNDFAGFNVNVYPGIVKKAYGSCSSIDDILMDNDGQAKFNIEQYRKHGIANSDFFPAKVGGECMARKIYGYLIDARGDIYKCWTDVGNKNEIVGNVSNNSSVNTTKLTRYLTGADPLDKQACQECFFLPVCAGGCPHMALKKQFEANPIDLCLVAKGNLKEFLEIYYEIKTRKKVAI